MPNQSWIKIQRDNGKEDYARVSRSKHYPEQGSKQMAKRSNPAELQPRVHSTSPGYSTNQLHTTTEDADDSSAASN